jgi:hypothetical protein
MAKEEKETKVNWNYVIAGSAAIGGVALLVYLVKTITGEDADKREQAERILADWQQEWDVAEPFMQSIYAGDVAPTQAQTILLGDQLEDMKVKELAIKELSQSTWSELGVMAKDIGIGLGIAIGVPVAGYVAAKLTNNWIDKNKPPPSYPCPVCDQIFATKGALKHHIETGHVIDYAQLAQAQQMFRSTPIFAQTYVATQSGYYNAINVDWMQVAFWVLVAAAVVVGIMLAAPIVVPSIGFALKGAMALALI